MRVFDIGQKQGPEVVSDRILTVPNLLSFARLAVLPLIYLDLVGDRFVRAFVLLVVFGATDWLDGYIARRFDQTSRLGKLLDPLSDRILFVVVGVGFVVAGLLPLWALVVLLIRDVGVLIGGAILVARGATPPEVTKLGKASTFGLMWAFPLFLAAAIAGDGSTQPQPLLHTLAWITFVINTVLHYLAALGYAKTLARR
jgi:cardiolipin synthase (CMP-forming)